MKINLDSQPITLTCLHCGKKFDEKVGRLKNNRSATCPHCRVDNAIDASELRRVLQSVQKSADKLGATLRKFGK